MRASNTSSTRRASTGSRRSSNSGSAGRSKRRARCQHFRVVDHLGWHAQGDGRFYLGLPIANGRIKDDGAVRLRTALRTIFSTVSARPILLSTPGSS